MLECKMLDTAMQCLLDSICCWTAAISDSYGPISPWKEITSWKTSAWPPSSVSANIPRLARAASVIVTGNELLVLFSS